MMESGLPMPLPAILFVGVLLVSQGQGMMMGSDGGQTLTNGAGGICVWAWVDALTCCHGGVGADDTERRLMH